MQLSYATRRQRLVKTSEAHYPDQSRTHFWLRHKVGNPALVSLRVATLVDHERRRQRGRRCAQAAV